MTKYPCERKCWTCGNVAMHADDVAPDVCCQKCGSQDTRRLKPSAANQAMTDREEQAQVGALLAKCSYVECGKDEDGWWACVRLMGRHSLPEGEGPTQLAAIKAAVEAAEKGVRE